MVLYSIHVHIYMLVRNSWRMMTYFTIEVTIRGCHIYKDVWDSSFGEQMFGEIEENNRYDSYVVVVVKTETVIGNVTQNMSLIYNMFLCWSGSFICCKVTGERLYYCNQQQGGVEIPSNCYFKEILITVLVCSKVRIVEYLTKEHKNR